jgi:hypothetical protein
MSDDHDFEPVRGLPQQLPSGEQVLWQGEPSWKGLALRAFHVRKVAIYFGILLAWRIATALSAGLAPLAFLKALAPLCLVGGAAVLALLGLAFWTGRTSIYTITNRRIALRIGIALSITVNVPFRKIDSAALRRYKDGTGDLPVRLLGADHIAYVPLWPHVRPWRFAKPDPMLRAVPDAERVAQILSAALEASRASSGATVGGSGRVTAIASNGASDGAANELAAVSSNEAAWPKAVA